MNCVEEKQPRALPVCVGNGIMISAMNEHQSGQPTTGLFQSFLIAPELNINDIPLEVMEIIFENIDSINRRKIERVCKGWMEIIRGSRRLQNHLLIELPLPCTQHDYWLPSYSEWFVQLRLMLKLDLEVMHFKPPDLSDGTVTNKGIHYILLFLESVGLDLSKVEIIFSDCTVDWEERMEYSALADAKTIRVLRSDNTASRWFGSSTLYFEELWLENLDELPQHIARLFLSENGPLTKGQSDTLAKFKRFFTIDTVLLIGRIDSLAYYLGWFRSSKYVDGYNWIEVLTVIAKGGHVSKHTVDYLARLPADFLPDDL